MHVLDVLGLVNHHAFHHRSQEIMQYRRYSDSYSGGLKVGLRPASNLKRVPQCGVMLHSRVSSFVSL